MVKKKWKNAKKVPCAICGEIVEEYLDFGESRTLKSWMYVCEQCGRIVNKIKNKIGEADRRITKLEKRVFGNN